MQDKIFFDSEGDNYFNRILNNKNWNFENKLQNDLPLYLIKNNLNKIDSVAEVGSSTGFRLNYLIDNYQAKADAYEPSKEAIMYGQKIYPDINFIRQTASNIDVADNSYDLVIVDFVLCWVDRTTLFKSLSNIDRILKNKGFLAIGDFDVPTPRRRFYHHLPKSDVWTYKQEYKNIFVSSNLYNIIDEKKVCNSQLDGLPRICTLLKKDLNSNYEINNSDL